MGDEATDQITLSQSEIREDEGKVARFCADEVTRAAAQFCDPASDEPTGRKLNAMELHRAAVAMTLKLVDAMETGGEEGAYLAEEEAPNLVPLAILRRGQSRKVRSKALAHELAHHIMRTKVAPTLYGANTVVCHGLDGRAIREVIARRVERMIAD